MSEQNGDGHKTATVQPPVGRPFSPGPDPRRNAGGRPKGLAAAARAAVGEEGADLIAFFSAIMRGDHKFLGEQRSIALRDRGLAASWLADRGFGKPPQTVEIADVERQQTAAALQRLADLPEELKAGIRAWLMERRERYLAEEREAAERRMLSFMPSVGTGGNGSDPRDERQE